MIVEGHCRQCNKWFPAHWHDFKGICTTCGSSDVKIVTDESHEPPENYRPFPGDSPVDYDNWI